MPSPRRRARLVETAPAGARARRLTFEMIEPAAIEFVGGQYFIFNTGATLADGRPVKRAYSVLSPDADGDGGPVRRFEIAVLRLGDGPGSNAMTDLAVGAEIEFGGPWGRFLPPPSVPAIDAVVLATDTGITAAIGLCRGRAFAPHAARTRVLWMAERPGDFLGTDAVRAALPDRLGGFEAIEAPPVGDPARIDVARRLVGDLPPSTRLWISGDGDVVSALRREGDPFEIYFNNPASKAPSRLQAVNR